MKKINFLARLFNCSLVFLFISCGGGGGDGSGDNPLDDPFGTLNENEPPDPAFKGDWDIVETLKQSSCPASGNTSEGFIEFSNGECFLYGAGNDGISVEEDLCKVAGKKGVIYTAGSLQVSDNCKLTAKETVTFTLQDQEKISGTFEGQIKLEGDCPKEMTDKFKSCKYSGDVTGKKSEEPKNSSDFKDPSFTNPPKSDQDHDGKPDEEDNCWYLPNPDQTDADGDGIGDLCEPDDDYDEVVNDDDNCRLDPNPDQLDTDKDGIGDDCEPDDDRDRVINDKDNCPSHYNYTQDDSDKDGIGDFCDDDADGDQTKDSQDNCPGLANQDQQDLDHDGKGDACDDDKDGDGVSNEADNCPDMANADQADRNKNGVGNICDFPPLIAKPYWLY